MRYPTLSFGLDQWLNVAVQMASLFTTQFVVASVRAAIVSPKCVGCRSAAHVFFDGADV
ncbi:MAG: hypothetical protein AAGF53_16785 [Pseudomonadota bacterium]